MSNLGIQRDMGCSGSPSNLIDRLPHRQPFLFLSSIESVESGVSGRARWQVRGDEAFFVGHFPGTPIVPGVLIVEALAQLAGLVALQCGDEPAHGAGEIGGRLAHVDARFDNVVQPPAVIDLRVSIQRSMGNLFMFDVSAAVDGTVAARGSLTVARVVEP